MQESATRATHACAARGFFLGSLLEVNRELLNSRVIVRMERFIPSGPVSTQLHDRKPNREKAEYSMQG